MCREILSLLGNPDHVLPPRRLAEFPKLVAALVRADLGKHAAEILAGTDIDSNGTRMMVF